MLTQLTHDIATPLSRRRWLAATAGLVLGLSAFGVAKAADDTIKVGVLHSLSGTMAISETTLKDTVLILIDEQNKKGGVLGKKLEAVVVDPGFELAAVRRKGPRADHQGQGRGRVRLLDLGVAQVRAAGVQGAELASCSTPCSTRAKRASATCSTPAPRRTSRRSRPSTT